LTCVQPRFFLSRVTNKSYASTLSVCKIMSQKAYRNAQSLCQVRGDPSRGTTSSHLSGLLLSSRDYCAFRWYRRALHVVMRAVSKSQNITHEDECCWVLRMFLYFRLVIEHATPKKQPQTNQPTVGAMSYTSCGHASSAMRQSVFDRKTSIEKEK